MKRAMQAPMLLALVLAGCSGASRGSCACTSRPEREAAPVQQAPPPRAVVAERPPPPPDPDPSSTCGKALACCRAYVSAIPDVVESSACAGVHEAVSEADPDARCRMMKEGWSQALTHLEGEPPDACR